MPHQLPELPYPIDALEPHLSRETLEYHHGKHHRAYVDKLNGLIANTPYEHQDLLSIIEHAEGAIFNNAAQIWNHTFYWHSLTPTYQAPSASLQQALDTHFGSLDDFKTLFTDKAIGHFGSGWTWLVQSESGLSVVNTSNADTPLRHGQQPLLTLDLWEHAYYIDHRNARPQYIEHFWSLVNWDFVEQNMQG